MKQEAVVGVMQTEMVGSALGRYSRDNRLARARPAQMPSLAASKPGSTITRPAGEPRGDAGA